MKKIIATILTLAAALAAQSPASTAPQNNPSNDELESRVKILERLRENDQEDQKTAKEKAPKADASAKGFRIEDAKGEYFLKIGGLTQATAQYFFNDSAKKIPNNYSLRRARLDVQTGLGKGVNFRLQAEFAPGSQASLLDAYIDLQPSPLYGLRAGRFTPPIGLEYTFSPVKTAFIDVSLASALLPIRDAGVQVQGDLGEGTVQYSLGVFNGTVDGNRTDTDLEDEKEVVGRLFSTPFISQTPAFLSGLSVGIGASAGKQASAPASYKSPGRIKIFSFKNPDTLQGWQVRIAPQGSFYYGSFGLTGEFVIEKQGIRDSLNSHAERLQHKAWQATISYIVTGEDASIKGTTASKPINGSGPGFGALEVVFRAHQLDLDNKSFHVFADSTKSVSSALAFAGGVNWYATKNVRLSADYSLTQFKGGAKTGNRPSERLVTTTANLNF